MASQHPNPLPGTQGADHAATCPEELSPRPHVGSQAPGTTVPHPYASRSQPPQPQGVSGDPNSRAASRLIAHTLHPGWGKAPCPCVCRGHPGLAVLGGQCAAAWLMAPRDAHGAGGQPNPAAPSPAGDFPLGGNLAPGPASIAVTLCDPHSHGRGDDSTLEPGPPYLSSHPPSPMQEHGWLLPPACPPAHTAHVPLPCSIRGPRQTRGAPVGDGAAG